MKKFLNLVLAVVGLSMTACSAVPAGSVGILVNKYGGNKGVDEAVKTPGYYWLTWNEEMFIFPTFQQNYTFTKNPHEGNPAHQADDESFTFQSNDGMSINADVGLSYHLETGKIPTVFQRYREGVVELTEIQIRNVLRSSLNEVSSTYSVTDLYGTKKEDFLVTVKEKMRKDATLDGIVIDNIYFVGTMRLPETIVAALNSKIEATQRAQQRQNEVAEAQAQAAKEVAKAQGEAQARLTVAAAEAKSNLLVSQSVTPNLIQYIKAKRWNGVAPIAGNGAGVFLDAGVVKQYIGGGKTAPASSNQSEKDEE